MLSARQLKSLRLEPGSPNRVKAAMRLAGVTQSAVADGTGLHQSQVSRIASNAGDGVTLATASRLASYFGCGVADLFPRETASQLVQGAA